jgi:DnaJ-class molecular chaperone
MARTHTATAVRCAFCSGSGRDPFHVLSQLSSCPACVGHGMVEVAGPLVPCAYCRGSGVQPHTTLTCSCCGGRGVQTIQEPQALCPRCGGEGADRDSELHLPCLGCHGAGWIHDRSAVQDRAAAPARKARHGQARPPMPRRPS